MILFGYTIQSYMFESLLILEIYLLSASFQSRDIAA